ncbi:hypothetical protein [Lysinibacillus sp. 3P01SB]|uniref:hypothetical protein n=1 Tax=Lysinibacillus sp. 3P01SB TaxID=3132284 RepID=UPI0039A5A2D2
MDESVCQQAEACSEETGFPFECLLQLFGQLIWITVKSYSQLIKPAFFIKRRVASDKIG